MKILIRPAAVEDVMPLMAMMEALPQNKATLERLGGTRFFVYPTLVAEVEGRVVGYTQFTLGLDNVLYSMYLRVLKEYWGNGIAQKLMEAKVECAKLAGATRHLYTVSRNGKDAVHKICLKLGMHLCHEQGDVLVYAQTFGEQNV